MKKIIITIITLIYSVPLFACGNVQLTFNEISNITYRDRALNHPGYFELLIRGKVIQTDAVIPNRPQKIPQNVSLLYRKDKNEYLPSFQTCLNFAQNAQLSKQLFLTIHLFMQPEKLLDKIEGGMVDNSFNVFVIKSDDSDFESIGCSLDK